MMGLIVAALLAFFITTLFGHVVHWSFHKPWSGSVHRAHMTHHLKLYPPTDYLSKVYRQAGADSTPKFFIISGAPLIIIPLILWYVGIISLSIMLTVIGVEILVGLLHNYLHDAFHISGHWLYRVPFVNMWFSHLVSLHYLHHVNMNSNFGIFTFHWDKVFKTFGKDNT